MNFKRLFLSFFVAWCALDASELVRVDEVGVIRWTADNREVALFGANYSLPSASDYRAAGYVGADRKKLVEQDMLHFARMGWDGMRLCLWGDWENSDKEGNLIVNDHLDVMDYAIAEAKRRGIYILLTPITTYSAWWPDGNKDEAYPGFSKFFDKTKLGTDPAAIAVQCNYLRQILNHVNPYTGVALKDEPQIIFLEMINEPHHHPEDFGGSVAYINALADAVRSTGCQKLLFHNLSQDMRIASAIKASTVPGVTFAWYPTGLNVGRTLVGNYLRTVDDFPPMLRPDLMRMPKIVYEFDSPDLNTGYMYPAMVRAFRGVGAQFAAMFSYDMLATAPYNLGWQTHFLNLVYSPRKALSAVIAAEAMRTLPRYGYYGAYPENRRFGSVRVSYEEDSSELVSDDQFLYANSTRTAPPAVAKLRRIAGAGSSPVISYEGNGAYFLDRLAEGVWRLEVYPDAITVADPFAQFVNYKTPAIRLVAHAWPMIVQLPDLGEAFAAQPLNEGNKLHATAVGGQFVVSPGVYLLSRNGKVNLAALPDRVGEVGLREFACPTIPALPSQILSGIPREYPGNSPVSLPVQVVGAELPSAVSLHLRIAGQMEFRSVALEREHGYYYAVTLPANDVAGGFEWYVTASTLAGEIRFPAQPGQLVVARAVALAEPFHLFDAAVDIPQLVYTRIGDAIRRGVFKALPASGDDPAALRLMFPSNLDRTLDDYTASLAVKERVSARGADHLSHAQSLRIKARGSSAGQVAYITLMEADGTAWSTKLTLTATWSDTVVPLTALRIAQGVKLPLGYPERWNYWTTPAQGRDGPADRLKIHAVEHVQISLRPEASAPMAVSAPADAFVDIASIECMLNESVMKP